MPAAGTPFSQILRLSSSINAQRVLPKIVSALEAVHGDGSMPTVAVEWGGTDDLGQFWPTPTPSIAVKPKQTAHGMSLLHEVGHAIDYFGLGVPGFASERGDLCLASWRRAVDCSAAVTRLSAMKDRTSAIVEIDGRRQRFALKRGHVKYLLRPSELFARSYAQFIIRASNNVELAAELDRWRGSILARIYPEQWIDTDFEAIEGAFEDLLRSLRWKT